MESRLRAIIDKMIDEGLKPERLRAMEKFLEDVSSYIVLSKEDALFGYFIGNLYGHLFYFTQLFYQRKPTFEERAELSLIIHRRSSEIKKNISSLG